MTLLHPCERARERPDAAALVMATAPAAGGSGSGDVISYAQLDERSNRMARALRAHGLATGDHVALLMENNHAYLEVAWAAQRAGLYYTAINSHLRAGEVQYILDDCGAKALVTSTAMSEALAGLDVSRIGLRVLVGGREGEMSHGDGRAAFVGYDELLAEYPPTPIADECEGRELLYSSGTTGRPKGVRKELPATPLGDPAAAVVIAQALATTGAGPDAVYLSPAPLYHSAPLVYCMSMHRLGAKVVVMERFDPAEFLALIERHRVTHTQLVPTMFVRLLRLSESQRQRCDISSLQFAVHAAAPCPVAVKRQMLDWWGPIIHEYYAGTEDIGSTAITPQEWLDHPGSVGRPLGEVHILDDNGNELPPGQPGTVYFAGGRPFEYHNDPAKTASITENHGWRTLGDVGYVDEDGYLYLTDRKAHMIISGGVNIYPQEAENVLASHPAVADVAVVGVPDNEMGEAVKAVVQLVADREPSDELADELLAQCRGELATYKCPRSVDFVDELPRDPNGKLYKRVLRERYWEGHDTRVI